MDSIFFLLILVLDIFLWLIIASVVVSWLVMFDVLNTRNKWVFKGLQLLNRLTEPVMSRLRKVIPPVGGIDITPIAVFFIIYLLKGFLFSMMR